MKRNFERRSGRNWKPEAEGLELFRRELNGWKTEADGVRDYCGPCWQYEAETQRFSKETKESFRPTSEFAEKRLGTDGWFATCQKCGKEVFVRLP